MEIKPVIRKKNVPVDQYCDIETGEVMGSGNRLQVLETTELSVVTSKDFVMIETDALLYICKMLSNADLNKFQQMCACLKTDLNIVYNHTIPHTRATLAQALEISEDEVTKLCKRLVKKGVLMKCQVAKSIDVVQEVYIVNPSVARKRRTINNEVLNLFKDFREIISQN